MTYQRNETPEAMMAPLTLDIGLDLGAQLEVKELAPRAAIGGWQPIETAPRDNARLLYLARFDDKGLLQELDFDGIWEYWEESWELSHINGWCWMSAKGIEEPTHWAYQDSPMPEAVRRPLKDHQIAKLVNDLRDVAKEYGQTQQLRERIAEVVRTALGGHAIEAPAAVGKARS
ncbi:hypothetical protein D9M72_181550 [compost metagenome]